MTGTHAIDDPTGGGLAEADPEALLQTGLVELERRIAAAEQVGPPAPPDELDSLRESHEGLVILLDSVRVTGPFDDALFDARVVGYERRLDEAAGRMRRLAEPPVQPEREPRTFTLPRIDSASMTYWVPTVLIMACIAVLGFGVHLFWVTDIQERREQRSLVPELEDFLLAYSAIRPAQDELGNVLETGWEVEMGDPVALIRIPDLGLSKVIVEGTDHDALRRGPGHFRESELPGRIGHSVIAGRRNSYGAPFRSLDTIRNGQAFIEVVTPEGFFTYRVQSRETRGSGEFDVFGPVPDCREVVEKCGFDDVVGEHPGEARLTLVTSHPELGASERLIVTALLEPQSDACPNCGDQAAEPSGISSILFENDPLISSTELGTTRDNGAWFGALLWGQLLLAAFVGARVLWRRWYRWSTWLIAFPVITTLAVLWYERLSRLLPSTF